MNVNETFNLLTIFIFIYDRIMNCWNHKIFNVICVLNFPGSIYSKMTMLLVRKEYVLPNIEYGLDD